MVGFALAVKVPFFDMAAELAPIRAELDAAIARVLDSGVFVGGEEVAAFERELAAYTGAAHAVGVSSGTDALHVLGMALGIGPGDEVVTTPLTFFATAGAFARLGATIVFADIDEETLTLDPAAALAACTPRTKLIVPVNLFGHPAALPEAAPCPVLEDAAQSIGSGPPRGLAAALSFFPTKNLGALGDAGAVLTHDPALADRVALLRTQGARPKYHHVALGGNFRLDALQAAVLRVKLAHLDRWTAARRAHAARYRELFAAANLPPEVRLPAHHPDHVYHQFVIRVPRRDDLRAHLAAAGIGTEVYYPEPLHRMPALSTPGDLPVAEQACREVLALPVGASRSVDERVTDLIADFYRGSAPE
jgi:dTDP-4-amino-4,6-dideoxygalactose transaminase